jgi:TIR domain
MAGVFINYRAVDQPLGASAIYAKLEEWFGADRVFLDCETIQPGEHYPTELRTAVREADALVAVIGPNWLTVTDPETRERRIHRERDWVRWEIATALELGIPVLPVLLKDTPEDAQMPAAAELPANIRPLSTRQFARISHLHLGADIDRLIGDLVRLAPALAVAKLFTRPPAPRTPENAPSTLLRAEHKVVPFTGRGAELADLRAWADGPAAGAAKLVVGPAGAGKTRLALQLCDELAKQRWLTGLTSDRAPAAHIRHTTGIGRPLLIVVDEAESRTDELVALAAAIGDRADSREAPTRLLLLARAGGAWLSELQAHQDKRVAELFRPITSESTLDLATGTLDRAGQFAAAWAAFAAQPGLTASAAVPARASDPARYESILDIHAAALAALLDSGAADTGLAAQPADPLDRVLAHDRRRRRPTAGTSLGTAAGTAAGGTAGDPSSTGTSPIDTVAALATLCRPASEEQALALRIRLPNFFGGDHPLDDYVAELDRRYPGPHSLYPIRPDALGERLVAGTLAAEPSIAVTLAATGTAEQVTNALTVLGQALPRHPELAPLVSNLVGVAPQRLVTVGIEVAKQLAEPEPFIRAVGGAVTDAVGDNQLSVDALFALADRLQLGGPALNPLRSVWLSSFTEAFARPLAKAAQQHAGGVPPAMQPLQQFLNRVETFALDLATTFLDPKSGRTPTGPDGKPIVPPLLLDTLRKLTVDGEWFGRKPPE